MPWRSFNVPWRGERSAWKVWSEVTGVTKAFTTIARSPFATLEVFLDESPSSEFKLTEKFIITMYDT